jgi:hypothetical protein
VATPGLKWISGSVEATLLDINEAAGCHLILLSIVGMICDQVFIVHVSSWSTLEIYLQ